MGVVFLAVAEGPGGFSKLKVVKRLRPDFAAEPRAVEMFLAEARLAARLRHPNVVQTNEVGFDGRHYFMEMEYLEGQSLEALLRRAEKAGGVPLPMALWILAQTCTGLHYAHELKDLDGTPLHVVHRDVSPHNVMVTYDGQVKVLDFGIAKAADSSADTQTGVIKGKARYMAPEQAARRGVDRRADVFAVGVMLWQALTGQRLWGELGDYEILVKLEGAAIPPPRDVKPDVPRALDALCERALARDPADRPATAAELGAALEAYLETSGARVGSREVAALMATLFGDRRAEVDREIEARIKGRTAAPETADVPLLPPAQEGAGTGSAALSHASSIRREPNVPTGVRQLREIRGLRRMTLAALGVALVASAVVVAFTVRARSRAAAALASASASAAASQCARNASCPHGSICRKPEGRCVQLETPECKLLAEPGDVENDATLWMGVMMPATGQRGPKGARFVRAVDLARRDFVQISGGLQPIAGEGPPRPLAFVACDDAEKGELVARHLVEDVGVPAVIGFGSSEEVVSLSTSVFLPHRVLVVPTLNQSALITSIPHPPGSPRLVFRTISSIAQTALPADLFVSDVLEPRIRRALPSRAPIKVAVVRNGSTAALSISDALFDNLRFNGKSALENGENFRQFVFADPASPADTRSYESVVSGLAAFAPHVILVLHQDLTTPIYAPLESRWSRALPYRPYVVSTTTLVESSLFDFIGSSEERRHRFFGVTSASTTMANAKFTMRYDETFPDDRVTTNNSPAGAYDAAYLLAYAAYEAGDEAAVTGPTLVRGISRLVPPGPVVDVGPTHILAAFSTLRSGANIDLNGAGSSLDFDMATGEPPPDAIIECVGVDARGKASDGIDSGLVYDAAAHALRGELRCP